MYYLNSFCFVCLSEKTLLRAICLEEIHYQIKYALPELMILYPEYPVYICSSCHTTLRSFSTFKKKCFDNYSRLNDYIKLLQVSKNTPEHSSSELQIITCEQLIKHKNDIHLNVEENEHVLMSCEEQHDQKTEIDDVIDVKEESLASEEIAHPDFYQQQQVVKIESVLDDIQDDGSNVLSENNNAVDKEQKIEVVTDIDVKEESLAESARPDLYQQVVKSESVLHNIQDGGSNILSEDNNAIDNDQKTEEDDDIDVKEESLTSEQSVHPDLYQVYIKSESVSDDKDGGSREANEDNNALDKYETNSGTNSKEFQCSMCKEVFTDKLTFDTHFRYHIKSTTGLVCLVCNKKFGRTTCLRKHMKLHLGIKDCECPICKKKFVDNGNLNQHIKTHEGIKNYECSICKKKYSDRSYLKVHLKIHTKSNFFECSICKKQFILSYYLQRHMKVHESKKNHECSICKKRFLRYSQLKIHIMHVHEDRKDFECLICKKKYVINYYLKRHMKTHGNRKDFECSICKKKFVLNSVLKKHMKIHEST